jgi:ABC-2 type transport system ATP-binding protein
MHQLPLRTEAFGRRYRRGRPWALRDLTLEISEGSITALVGPNGSGKTTLIRACVGFEPADEGRILVYGSDVRRARTAAVEAVGYVPQQSALYRGLTIGDHFVMARAARHAFDHQIAGDRISDAGLSEDRVVGELSGGEQAQVGLALALGTRAPLLLLDEPLANLDPLARRQFLTALLHDVRGRGATAILSSHVVTDVEQACDQLVVLARGRLALHMSIADAKRAFSILSMATVDGQSVVGAFPAPDGVRLALVRGGEVGRAATLEEIVLGHLAAEAVS